jgi:hypothetical protein
VSNRVFTPAMQLLLSAIIGLCAAVCCALFYWLACVSAGRYVDEVLGETGLPCCVYPAVLGIGGYFSGRFAHRLLGKPHWLLKTALATPAAYLILWWLGSTAISDPKSFREMARYELLVTFDFPLLLLCSWLCTLLGFRLARRAPQPGDEPRCEKCDYLLIGLSEPRCPECGTPFDPNRAAPKP